MQWYYSKNSTQLGPISDQEMREKTTSGEILKTDMVWREGMPDWSMAGNVPELSMVTPPPPPHMASPGQTGGGILNTPYSPPSIATGYATQVANIPNYLWQSIVVTILCCLPLGIPAIVYAAKVDNLKASGNIAGALEASANAKKWCIISLFSCAVLVAIKVAGLTTRH